MKTQAEKALESIIDDITQQDVSESQSQIDMFKHFKSYEMNNGSKYYCHVDPAIGKDKSSIVRGFTTDIISTEDLVESVEILDNCHNFGFVKE